MQTVLDDYIEMNQAGQVLELCKKYYHENVFMLSNGAVFAQSMQEAYEKQKGFIGSVKSFDVILMSQKVKGNIVELIFNYNIVGENAKVVSFTGKHIQTWEKNKIVKEEYHSI